MLKKYALLILLAISSSLYATQIEQDTKRMGTLIERELMSTSDPTACVSACDNSASCKSFNFAKPGAWSQISTDKAVCDHYNDKPPKVSDTCCISGVKGLAQIQPPPSGMGAPAPNPSDYQTREEACKDFADTMTKAATENIDRKCGFSTSVWKGDPVTNYQWCLQDDNVNRVPSIIKSLREQLEQCRECERYSNSAVSQNQEYEANYCGVGGDIWSSDYAYHFDWCMHGNNQQLFTDRYDKKRAGLLKQCQPLYGDFTLDSIKPFLYDSGYLDHIEIDVSADSSKPWLVGRYGIYKEGSMWLHLTVSNKTGLGVKKIHRDYSITGLGSIKEHIPTFMSPFPGQQVASGSQKFTVKVSAGYPGIRFEAFKMIYHHPGGIISNEGFAQPGSFKCDFSYPDVEATLFIMTPNGVKYHSSKLFQFEHPSVYFNKKYKSMSAFGEVPQRGSGPCP